MAKKIIIAVCVGAGLVIASLFATKKLMIPSANTIDDEVE